MLQDFVIVGGDIMAKRIDTATIYTAPGGSPGETGEWERFKAISDAAHRTEAGQLAFLAEEEAKKMKAELEAGKPICFRLIPRPEGCKPGTQVKTKKAAEYLAYIATIYERETKQKVTQSEIVETLVRRAAQM